MVGWCWLLISDNSKALCSFRFVFWIVQTNYRSRCVYLHLSWAQWNKYFLKFSTLFDQSLRENDQINNKTFDSNSSAIFHQFFLDLFLVKCLLYFETCEFRLPIFLTTAIGILPFCTRSSRHFLMILWRFLECHEKSLYCPLCVFNCQNVDQPHFMWQQPITLIFSPVIEYIKFYHLGYFSVLARQDKTSSSKQKDSAETRICMEKYEKAIDIL